jgi:hypothetical protein
MIPQHETSSQVKYFTGFSKMIPCRSKGLYVCTSRMEEDQQEHIGSQY